MVPLCERDGWTQRLGLLEEAEEAEVSGAETMEIRLQGLESKPQAAAVEEGVIPTATGNDVSRAKTRGEGGNQQREKEDDMKGSLLHAARHALTTENKSGKDLRPDPKSEANLSLCLSKAFFCLVTSRDVSTMTGKCSSLSTKNLSLKCKSNVPSYVPQSWRKLLLMEA